MLGDEHNIGFEGDPKYIQLVLRIVLEMPDLVVVDVRTQVFVENLLNRSVRLDVLATCLIHLYLNTNSAAFQDGNAKRGPGHPGPLCAHSPAVSCSTNRRM